ncbi:MAG: HdeD family acid-resistance protein [Blastococcus sp.]
MAVPPVAAAATHRPAADRVAAAARSPALVVAEGAAGIAWGVVVLTWPSATATVLAWLFGTQLLLTGALQFVVAAVGSVPVARVLMCLLGTLSIVMGLLCLRSPLQTTAVLGLLVGLTWVVTGMIRVVQGAATERGSTRAWRIGSGTVGLAAGGAVLVYADLGLVALVSLVGIVLLAQGTCLVAAALTAGSARKAPGTPAADRPHLVTAVPPVPPASPRARL